MGVKGIVFGILNKNKSVNLSQIQALAMLAKPLKVTFHKAIDATENILLEFYKLLVIKEIDSVLTSGGKNTAMEGAAVLQKMVHLAGKEIEVLSAGKISWAKNCGRFKLIIEREAPFLLPLSINITSF